MKKRLWIIHSWLGLIAGLGLLIIGVTGTALVFRDQLDGIFAAERMRVVPTAEGRLPWDQLLTSAEKAWPDYVIAGFGPRREADLADLVYVKERGSEEFRATTLNPYTGEAMGNPIHGRETLTGFLLELHYTWFADHIGMLVTGILAVMLCLLGATGVWLYRDFWKSFFTLRWGKSARIILSDTHKMVGISTVPINLILGFTGAYWNITHVAAEGLLHVEHEVPVIEGRLYSDKISLDVMTVEAKKQISGFQVNWISFPTEPGTDITLWGSASPDNPLSGYYGSTATFDAQTGALKSHNDLRTTGLWARTVDAFTPLHYGTFGGWPIKIIWSLAGLTPGILAVSGFLIWRSRQPKKRESLGAVPAVAREAEARA